MSESILGYWFARAGADGVVRLPHGDGRVVRVGETLTVDGPIVPCEHGLHASRCVRDALMYAPGPWLAVVRLGGEIVEQTDKLAASARTTLWLADVGAVLRRFACDVAERALLGERAAGREPDARSWAAIAVTRRWIAGAATDEQWAAAEAAAWAAEVAAADVVDVARAARAAADAAARDAAEAAWSAAQAAAWAARAAWSAELTWQEAHLLALLHAAGMPEVQDEPL